MLCHVKDQYFTFGGVVKSRKGTDVPFVKQLTQPQSLRSKSRQVLTNITCAKMFPIQVRKYGQSPEFVSFKQLPHWVATSGQVYSTPLNKLLNAVKIIHLGFASSSPLSTPYVTETLVIEKKRVKIIVLCDRDLIGTIQLWEQKLP